jgi:hypothetical protein
LVRSILRLAFAFSQDYDRKRRKYKSFIGKKGSLSIKAIFDAKRLTIGLIIKRLWVLYPLSKTLKIWLSLRFDSLKK